LKMPITVFSYKMNFVVRYRCPFSGCKYRKNTMVYPLI
jgi:hypothetical protein